MPSIEIKCSGCQLYLGVIHKATLRKNISHLCENCETIRYGKIGEKEPVTPLNTDDFSSIFGNIFGDKK